MGATTSKCNAKNTSPTPNFTEISQRLLEKQPNWLVTPTKWRSHDCSHQPVRYRTPTPYPKDDRRRLPAGDYIHHSRSKRHHHHHHQQQQHLSEKTMVVIVGESPKSSYTPAVKHIEIAEPLDRKREVNLDIPPLTLPPAAVPTITWESQSPSRQNRFERIC